MKSIIEREATFENNSDMEVKTLAGVAHLLQHYPSPSYPSDQHDQEPT